MSWVGVAVGGGALLGGFAGAMGSKNSQTSVSGVNMAPATDLENQGSAMTAQGASQFSDMVGAGPGQSDVSNALTANRDLASMYGQYAQGGFMPNAQDMSSSNTFAQAMFNPQRVQMQQQFMDQGYQANQQSTLMGRAGNDPILQAKLATEQSRQSAQLGAQQGAFANQYAQQMPMMRLNMAGQQAGIMSGLASQAMANRQALAAMGSGIMGQERNWRYQSGQHYGNETQTSGGGIAGGIMGAMAGAGAGMGVAKGFGSGGGMPSGGDQGMGGQGMLSGMNYNQSGNDFFGVSSGNALAADAGLGPNAMPAAPQMPQQSGYFNGGYQFLGR